MNTSHPLSAVAIAALLLGAASCAAPDRPLPESDADSTAVAPAKPDSAAADTVAAVDSTAIKLEEAKSFRTTDLSSLLLHGHVKTMSIYCGGGVECTYQFSKKGTLTKYSDPNCRKGMKPYFFHRNGNLIIGYESSNGLGGWATLYTVDSHGRLKSELWSSDDNSEETTYTKYDSNGWPTRYTSEEEFGGKSSGSCSYSALDEYGNWTKRSDGITRKIEYYEK